MSAGLGGGWRWGGHAVNAHLLSLLSPSLPFLPGLQRCYGSERWREDTAQEQRHQELVRVEAAGTQVGALSSPLPWHPTGPS